MFLMLTLKIAKINYKITGVESRKSKEKLLRNGGGSKRFGGGVGRGERGSGLSISCNNKWTKTFFCSIR